jgi:ribonuclease HI
LNPRPLGYEPSELPNCSTPRRVPLLYELQAGKASRHQARGGGASGPVRGYPSGMTEVVIYTDGACSGNPGRGGWGAVLRWNGTEKELHGSDPQTTNNRMELMAAISALEALNRPSQVKLHTDSKYLLDGITKWIAGWQRNGWRTSAKKPVKNEDLWRRLIAAMNGHEVTWQWVKGHAGDEGNERADELARLGVEEAADVVR